MAHRSRQRPTNDPSTIQGLDESLLSAPLAPSPLIDPTEGFTDPSVFSVLDDRRYWQPDPAPVPSTIYGTPAIVQAPQQSFAKVQHMMEMGLNPAQSITRHIPKFHNPAKHVIECVKRKIRREVMFSLPERKRKRGAGARRRRDEWSDYHC